MFEAAMHMEMLEQSSEKALRDELAKREARLNAGLCPYCERLLEIHTCKFSKNANKLRMYFDHPRTRDALFVPRKAAE